MSYQLWYWPDIPGRGEFVRLFLEAGEIPYDDMAREQGSDALVEDMEARRGIRPFAPPYLVADDLVIGQTAHILAFLSDRHGLGSGEPDVDAQLIQLQLDVSDMVEEVHATHHPIASSLFYADQMDAAWQRAADFRAVRLPKWLAHFESALEEHDGPFVLGEHWTHVDTSLWQMLEGLDYAFPNLMQQMAGSFPHLQALQGAVPEIGGVADYLVSERRIDFNQDGIFRHYPELDEE